MMRGCLLGLLLALGSRGGFRAGAAVVDVTPEKWPVVVNGGFIVAGAASATSPLFARALALDDGTTALAICVVDSCMMPRELIDEAKELAARETGLPTNRMLVSATHTHTAPSTMGSLGAPADADYVKFLVPRIARAIADAHRALAPARAGWAVVPAPELTNCRQWIRRPDRMIADPFGERSVRSNMHPGYQNPDVIGPSGPVDPDLSLLSVQTADGKPLALLGNYSMHYFGAKAVSADYFGLFCRAIEERRRAENPRFVAILSQGTSGDQHWMDYSKPRKNIGLDEYARALADLADRPRIEHREHVTLAMAETTLQLRRRVADEKRLAWAKEIAGGMVDRLPKNQREVYACEQLSLAAEPLRELKLQALRIGELGIATMPNEVFGITGLKVKARSPLETTFTIELANGSEGYIPPPEHHKLGGYTTWAARTAGLEVDAEPRILEAVLGLLEQVAGKPRRVAVEPRGAYAGAVLASKPVAYFRMSELDGEPRDLVGKSRATYEDGVVHGLPGPEFAGETNRGAHFAGGRMRSSLKGDRYSVEFWFWNGLPETARPVTGILMSRGHALGLVGTGHRESAGRLFLAGFEGKTVVPMRTWNHVVVSRDGDTAAVYLNGRPEIQEKLAPAEPSDDLFVGGGADPASSLEGKIDELALYDRPLSAEEAARHFSSAGLPK